MRSHRRALRIIAGVLLGSSHPTVSQMEHSHFKPLPCNNAFSMPCQPLDVGTIGTSPYVIPCGTCQLLDGTHTAATTNDTLVNFIGGLNVEGHLQILPPTDAAATLWITAPFVFVQGKLTVDTESFPDRLGAIHIELVVPDDGGDTDVKMVPHPSNSMACARYENGACNVGKRPFVVAGGEVDIRGYAQSCPSWTNLVDVVRGVWRNWNLLNTHKPRFRPRPSAPLLLFHKTLTTALCRRPTSRYGTETELPDTLSLRNAEIPTTRCSTGLRQVKVLASCLQIQSVSRRKHPIYLVQKSRFRDRTRVVVPIRDIIMETAPSSCLCIEN